MSGRSARGSARVAAQAKLNLLLRILSREPNGYHQITTLFQRIALADTVTVRTAVSGRSLDMRGAEIGRMEQNLAWRAALAFAVATGWPKGFAIEIEKRIPVGGGLGGGSADAAAVLRSLNDLAPRALGVEALDGIAFALGADVPYLTTELPLALGSGRGERLLALEPLPSRDVMLAVPRFGVATEDAFAWYADAHADGEAAARAPLLLPTPLSWRIVAAYASNDLEAPVFARHPELEAMRGALESRGASIARMTGSGSTLFGVFEAPTDDSLRASLEVSGPNARWIDTTTVERVPVVELL